MELKLKTDSWQVFGELYLVQVVYKLSIEGWLFLFALHNFSQMFWRIKTNFYHPTTTPVLQFYLKELLWNKKSREHRLSESVVQPVCECFRRATRPVLSDSQAPAKNCVGGVEDNICEC